MVCDFFARMICIEKGLDFKRQMLARCEEFEPYSLFKSIASSEDNQLSWVNLFNFLKGDGRGLVSDLHLKLLLHSTSNYDKENFGLVEKKSAGISPDNFAPLIDYKTFSCMVLPKCNSGLRELMSERKLVANQISDAKAYFLMRHQLTKLILQDIGGFREMASELRSLEEQQIDPRKIIRVVIGRELSHVTLNFERIRNFLINEMQLCIEDREISSVMKRLDPSDSGKIGLLQIEQYFQVLKLSTDPSSDNLLKLYNLSNTIFNKSLRDLTLSRRKASAEARKA